LTLSVGVSGRFSSACRYSGECNILTGDDSAPYLEPDTLVAGVSIILGIGELTVGEPIGEKKTVLVGLVGLTGGLGSAGLMSGLGNADIGSDGCGLRGEPIRLDSGRGSGGSGVVEGGGGV